MAMWCPWDHQWNFLLGSGPTAACKHGGSLQTALERSAPASLADRLKHKTTEKKQAFHTLTRQEECWRAESSRTAHF